MSALDPRWHLHRANDYPTDLLQVLPSRSLPSSRANNLNRPLNLRSGLLLPPCRRRANRRARGRLPPNRTRRSSHTARTSRLINLKTSLNSRTLR